MNSTISVLCPTRGRPGILACTLRLLRHLARKPERIEILLYVDDDDPIDYASDVWPKLEARGKPPVLGYVIRGPRYGYPGLNNCFNTLAKQASGRWLLLFNDDVFMATPNWDVVLDGVTDDVCVALTEANHGRNPCIFPFFTKSLVDITGHMSLNTHSDTWIEEVGRAAGIAKEVPITVFHAMLDDDLAKEGKKNITDTSKSYYTPEMLAARAADVRAIHKHLGGK